MPTVPPQRSVRAWALLVVSSEGQSATLPDQRAWANATAAERGWAIERVFEDVSSGKRGVRRLLTEMITALREARPASRPAWVLMIRADRVGRGRIAESQIALHEIVDLGCRIWTRNEGELKLDTAMDQLISAARQATAAFENEVRAEKAAAYYGKRRTSGAPSVTNKRPYGLRVIKGGQLELVPGEAEIVAKIFEMRIAGAGCTTIGKAVAPIAPLPLRADGSARKSPPRWKPYTIIRMIRNRKYRGTIVDELTWHRAQAEPVHLAGRHWNTSPVYPWPLAGAIRCWCGAAMYGQPGGHPSRRIRYYACNQPARHRRKLVRADDLEGQFYSLLLEIEAAPKSVVLEPDPALPLLEGALRAAHAQMAECGRQRDEVWEMHAARLVRTEDVQDRLDTLAAKREACIQRIADIEMQLAVATAPIGIDGPEIVAQTIATWQSATPLEQRQAVHLVARFAGGLYVDRAGQLHTGVPAEMTINALA